MTRVRRQGGRGACRGGRMGRCCRGERKREGLRAVAEAIGGITPGKQSHVRMVDDPDAAGTAQATGAAGRRRSRVTNGMSSTAGVARRSGGILPGAALAAGTATAACRFTHSGRGGGLDASPGAVAGELRHAGEQHQGRHQPHLPRRNQSPNGSHHSTIILYGPPVQPTPVSCLCDAGSKLPHASYMPKTRGVRKRPRIAVPVGMLEL
jgi:hypothetical protein